MKKRTNRIFSFPLLSSSCWTQTSFWPDRQYFSQPSLTCPYSADLQPRKHRVTTSSRLYIDNKFTFFAINVIEKVDWILDNTVAHVTKVPGNNRVVQSTHCWRLSERESVLTRQTEPEVCSWLLQLNDPILSQDQPGAQTIIRRRKWYMSMSDSSYWMENYFCT